MGVGARTKLLFICFEARKARLPVGPRGEWTPSWGALGAACMGCCAHVGIRTEELLVHMTARCPAACLPLLSAPTEQLSRECSRSQEGLMGGGGSVSSTRC